MSSPDTGVATADGKTVVSPARFHHVGIKTRQLQPMIEFYTRVLGVEPVAMFPFAVFMTYDNEANHRVVIFNDDNFTGQPDYKKIGLHHLAYEYDSIDDLLTNYLHLKELGIEPVWTTDHGPTISFYYNDPDGNLIELQVDNHGGYEGSRAFMESQDYLVVKPLGCDLDAEKLMEAWRAGATLAELHQRAYYDEEFMPDGGPVGPPGMD